MDSAYIWLNGLNSESHLSHCFSPSHPKQRVGGAAEKNKSTPVTHLDAGVKMNKQLVGVSVHHAGACVLSLCVWESIQCQLREILPTLCPIQIK